MKINIIIKATSKIVQKVLHVSKIVILSSMDKKEIYDFFYKFANVGHFSISTRDKFILTPKGWEQYTDALPQGQTGVNFEETGTLVHSTSDPKIAFMKRIGGGLFPQNFDLSELTDEQLQMKLYQLESQKGQEVSFTKYEELMKDKAELEAGDEDGEWFGKDAAPEQKAMWIKNKLLDIEKELRMVDPFDKEKIDEIKKSLGIVVPGSDIGDGNKMEM